MRQHAEDDEVAPIRRRRRELHAGFLRRIIHGIQSGFMCIGKGSVHDGPLEMSIVQRSVQWSIGQSMVHWKSPLDNAVSNGPLDPLDPLDNQTLAAETIPYMRCVNDIAVIVDMGSIGKMCLLSITYLKCPLANKLSIGSIGQVYVHWKTQCPMVH